MNAPYHSFTDITNDLSAVQLTPEQMDKVGMHSALEHGSKHARKDVRYSANISQYYEKPSLFSERVVLRLLRYAAVLILGIVIGAVAVLLRTAR